MSKVTLSVPEISCEHCEHAIVSALAPVPGVRTVQVDIDTRLVMLDFDESTLGIERVKEILKEEEYPVESVSVGS